MNISLEYMLLDPKLMESNIFCIMYISCFYTTRVFILVECQFSEQSIYD